MARALPSRGASSGKPRKSPLRVAAVTPLQAVSAAAPGRAPLELTGEQLRTMMISEFCGWLRSRTNKQKRPYQEETITAYAVAARALSSWMAAAGLEGDFTACDTGVLNRFFRDGAGMAAART